MMVSIIIPVYNVKRFLRECIDSILISKKIFEVILIDDGSTDGSSIICDEYSSLDNRVVTYHKKNGGVSSARNYGLKKAVGDYIVFVDSDDVLSNNWDELLEFLKGSDIYYFNSLIQKKLDKEILLKYITGANNDAIYLSAIYSKAYKRDFLINNNIQFDEKLINGEDMLFNVQALLCSKSFEKADFHYYHYRQALGQATRKFDERLIESDKYFHIYLKKTLENFEIEDSLAKQIENYCLYSAVELLLKRISYIDKYNNAKKYFYYLEASPYKELLDDTTKNKSLLIKLCKRKKYMIIFYYLKCRNYFSVKYRKSNQFIDI